MNSYIALDLETTGLDPKRDKIMEIGALKIIDGQIREEYSTLVNPRRDMSEMITNLTGISSNMVADAPDIGMVLPSVLDFFGDLPLLGHKILFDFSFIKKAAVNCGRGLERGGIDTLVLCRRFMPEDRKKNLGEACSYFQVETGRSHRALSDAKAAHLLYQKLRDRYLEENPEVFSVKTLFYKVKKEQPATKRQKEYLRDLIKYHKITITAQIDYMSRNEVSRLTDKIILRYGKSLER